MVYAAIVAGAALAVVGAALWWQWQRRGGSAAGEPLPAVPRWASFFTPRQYHLFLQKVQRHFARKGRPFRIDDGTVYVAAPGNGAADGTPEQFGLQNLAQLCHQAGEDRWDEAIDGHFASMDRGRQEQADLDAVLGDFEKVRDLLAVRLGPKDAMPLADMIWREDLPGTVSYVVLDLPSTIRTVNPDEARPWCKSADELFAVGLENVRRRTAPEASMINLTEDVQCAALLAESFFVASHALMLGRRSEYVGPGGALVAVPHRHMLLVCPLESVQVVGAVHQLRAVAQGMFDEGPGSISPLVYWYRDGDGSFEEVPITIDAKTRQATVKPTDAFLKMLEGLAPPQPAKP